MKPGTVFEIRAPNSECADAGASVWLAVGDEPLLTLCLCLSSYAFAAGETFWLNLISRRDALFEVKELTSVRADGEPQ